MLTVPERPVRAYCPPPPLLTAAKSAHRPRLLGQRTSCEMCGSSGAGTKDRGDLSRVCIVACTKWCLLVQIWAVELAFLSRKTTSAPLTISRPATTTTTMTTSPPDISSLTLSPQRPRPHDAYDNSQFDNRYQHFQTSPAVVPSPGLRRALPQVRRSRPISREFLLNSLSRHGSRISRRRRYRRRLHRWTRARSHQARRTTSPRVEVPLPSRTPPVPRCRCLSRPALRQALAMMKLFQPPSLSKIFLSV